VKPKHNAGITTCWLQSLRLNSKTKMRARQPASSNVYITWWTLYYSKVQPWNSITLKLVSTTWHLR